MSNPRVVFPAIALAVGLAGVTSAQAQNLNQPPPPPGPRVGWEVGFGLYGGEINCENENGDFCDGVTEAGGIDLHVNYFFRPHLGAYFDVFPMVHSENNWTFTHNVVTAGVIGVGADHRPRHVRWLRVYEVGGAWVLSVPACALLGALVTWVLRLV